MLLPHRLQGQKVKSQGGAGAYCGGHLAAQLVVTVFPEYHLQINKNTPQKAIARRPSRRDIVADH